MMLSHHGALDKLKLFHLEDGGFHHQRDYKILDPIYFENNEPVLFVHSVLIRFISPLQLDERSSIKTNLSNFTKSGLSFSSMIFTNSDRKIATSEVIAYQIKV